VFKGVDENYQWNYLQDYLIEGNLPKYEAEGMTNEVLISSYLANRLELKVGEKLPTYFLRNQEAKVPNVRSFTIVGIYDSGFPQFDEIFVLVDLKHVQRLNRWEADKVGGFEVFVNDFSKIDQISVILVSYIPCTIIRDSINTKYFSIFVWLQLFVFLISFIVGLVFLVAMTDVIVPLLVFISELTLMI